MKHIVPGVQFPLDTHERTESDFTELDRLYSGKKAYFGDFHAHAATGGTSDGETTLSEWKQAMEKMNMDFVGIMDHRQVRHMYLDEFDPSFFLYGTEPAGVWHEPRLVFHYLMIFPQRGTLEKILEEFPDVFEFEGTSEGHFKYIRVDKNRFMQVKDAVIEAGGAFIHAHPKQQMESTNVDDFNFGDGTGMEIIYTTTFNDPLNPHTVANYKLWTELLSKGVKMYNTATKDAHGAPGISGLNAVYAAEKHASDIAMCVAKGNVNSGIAAVKMCIGEACVGATAKYEDGMELQLKVDDFHSSFDVAGNYRVDIITDKGIAYSAPLTPDFAVSLKVKKRAFYRAEILRECDGAPMAIGNPIWLD
ncbi:MAG: hypothetical protein E7588_09170 [Ruminococcaceae bacterium]|nr:hypothetical protein [Oscillospiraceae bacterium]